PFSIAVPPDLSPPTTDRFRPSSTARPRLLGSATTPPHPDSAFRGGRTARFPPHPQSAANSPAPREVGRAPPPQFATSRIPTSPARPPPASFRRDRSVLSPRGE